MTGQFNSEIFGGKRRWTIYFNDRHDNYEFYILPAIYTKRGGGWRSFTIAFSWFKWTIELYSYIG